MKKILLLFFFASAITSLQAQTVDDPNEGPMNGVWWNFTNSPSISTMSSTFGSELKGTMITFKWSDIEPLPGKFNFVNSNFKSRLTSLYSNKFRILLMIYTGQAAPKWLYTTPYNVCFYSNGSDSFPDYKSAIYITRWHQMLDTVFKYVRDSLGGVKDSLKIFQSAEGSTGDEVPFKSPYLSNSCGQSLTDFPYTYSDTAWLHIRERHWQWLTTELSTYFHSATRASHSNVTLLVNPGNDSITVKPYTDFLADTSNHLQYAWLKTGDVAHGYQLNLETLKKSFNDPFINNVVSSCKTKVRSRGEMDETLNGWFAEAKHWNFYWLALNGLHFGLDNLMVTSSSLADTNYQNAFDIFNKYAGLKDSTCANKGFCALRDGLDASDFNRFSSATYGSGTFANFTARAQNILATYATSFGAKQEDTAAANKAAFNQRNATAMNDIGWRIFPDNYEKFIHQINQSSTSIYKGGFWRVGPVDAKISRYNPMEGLEKDLILHTVSVISISILATT